MTRLALLLAFPVALLAPSAVSAQETSPEMLNAALQTAVEQRNAAQNEVVSYAARLAVAMKETARLRKELEDARKPATEGAK